MEWLPAALAIGSALLGMTSFVVFARLTIGRR
jgi:hypothetical protein